MARNDHVVVYVFSIDYEFHIVFDPCFYVPITPVSAKEVCLAITDD